eukprot:5022657-Prymnesium_polylepis.1
MDESFPKPFIDRSSMPSIFVPFGARAGGSKVRQTSKIEMRGALQIRSAGSYLELLDGDRLAFQGHRLQFGVDHQPLDKLDDARIAEEVIAQAQCLDRIVE